jgi:hypothetical protein
MTRFVMPLIGPRLSGSAAWTAFWTLVAVGSLSAGAVGSWLMRTRLPAALARTRQAMRLERTRLRDPERPEPADEDGSAAGVRG